MKYQVVAPFIHRPFFDECMKDCKIPKENILVIDNAKKNVGLVRSWNMGVEAMYENGADWLIHLSSAIRFGERGGLDFIDVLKQNPDHYVIHAATENVKPEVQHKPEGKQQKNGIFGWHLTAFHRTLFDNVGKFDENFQPYGADDKDLSVRVQKFYKGQPGWDTYPVDVTDTVMAHGVKFAGIETDVNAQIQYFKDKWGTWDSENIGEYYDHPFNDEHNDLSYWPQPPNVLAVNHGFW